MNDKVKTAVERISQFLKLDGGGVELVDIEGDTVKVRLTGACAGCAMSTMTLRNSVERAIKEEFPEIKSVVAV